jgi:hypothetical protein
MANGFTFNLGGLEKALADIEAYGRVVKEEVNMELTATAHEAADLAKQIAPKDLGALVNGIVAGTSQNEVVELASNAGYSGFQEFGSGTNVDIPADIPGLAEYALQFKGEGKEGTHPVKFRDGSWRMVPYQVNLPAKPFFFPSILTATQNMIPRIKSILEDAGH